MDPQPSPIAQMPLREVAAGTVLIEEGLRTDQLFVLQSGELEVVRNGIRIVLVKEPGAFVGEISAVLGSAPSATVVATQPSRVHVIAPASEAVRNDPALTLAIAQLLARRLQAVTAYLVDIQQQYAGTNTHLAVMDQVLASLMDMQPATGIGPESERSDVPDY